MREVRKSWERVQEASDKEQSSEGIVVDELRGVRHVIQEGARAREPSGQKMRQGRVFGYWTLRQVRVVRVQGRGNRFLVVHIVFSAIQALRNY